MRLNLSIRRRMAIAITFLTIIVVLPALVGLVFTLLNTQAIHISEVTLEGQQAIEAVSAGLISMDAGIQTLLVNRNLESTYQVEATIQSLNLSIDILVNTILGIHPVAITANRDHSAEVRQVGDEYVQAASRLLQAARTEDWQTVQELFDGELNAMQATIVANLENISQGLSQDMRQSIDETNAIQQFLRYFWPGLVLASLGLGAIIVTMTTRSILGPVQELTELVRRVTQRDFSPFEPLVTNDELGDLSRAFATLTNWLRELYDTLEQRVADRTRDLERRTLQMQVAAEMARNATQAQDLEGLLNNAVELIRGRFGYYHAGIFIVDDNHEYAVLRAATGEPGRKMLAAGHQLRVGEVGIVGFVTSTGRPRIAHDVGRDAAHIRNLNLPETRAEMALPLKISGRIMGALDVQSRFPEAFSEQDVTALQIMADQLAIAIENTRLLEQSRHNLSELQTVYGRLSRESWQDIHYRMPQPGFEYERGEVHPINVLSPESGDDLAGDQELVHLSVPMRVRGELIGQIDFWTQPDAISPQLEDTLEQISDRISQALESARLFEEVQGKAEREQLVNSIAASIQETLDIDLMLQTAIREIGRSLQVEEVEVRMHQA